jgi:hypothetical protein
MSLGSTIANACHTHFWLATPNVSCSSMHRGFAVVGCLTESGFGGCRTFRNRRRGDQNGCERFPNHPPTVCKGCTRIQISVGSFRLVELLKDPVLATACSGGCSSAVPFLPLSSSNTRTTACACSIAIPAMRTSSWAAPLCIHCASDEACSVSPAKSSHAGFLVTRPPSRVRARERRHVCRHELRQLFSAPWSVQPERRPQRRVVVYRAGEPPSLTAVRHSCTSVVRLLP